MATLSFEIITPDGLKFQEDVFEVTLPTPQGNIGVLPHHIPLISIVTPGVISIRRHDSVQEEPEHLATEGGFVEINGKHVRLLADTAERADDIDELKTQEALAQARQLRAAAKDQISLADATALIEKQSARLKAAEIKPRPKSI